jgi:hypothetical protein
MGKKTIKELDREIDSLRSSVWFLNDMLINIKDWLEQEAEGQEVIDEYEGGLRPKCTDGTDDMIEGRVESANALLEQIKKWENEDED